jgi:hypothetical protein
VKSKTDLAVELGASVTTLAGMYLGSTEPYGLSFYAAANVLWYWMCWRQKIWGVMPLNVATTVVVALNLWRLM